ncbi:ubiquitin-related modifier 1 isoform X2 [Brachyhypopomus gauderio]|uniref:ubiquitin-related modifier 1 isoform X2 n=1 Tax=Brachyhypopomus gauderio TaxID=698409 RepID=UPI004041DBC3
MASPVAIRLQFGGGAELLFDGVKDQHVTLPSQSKPWNMKQLLAWIRGNLLRDRPELFVQGDSVRPGILVLINDTDWELMTIPTEYDIHSVFYAKVLLLPEDLTKMTSPVNGFFYKVFVAFTVIWSSEVRISTLCAKVLLFGEPSVDTFPYGSCWLFRGNLSFSGVRPGDET